ncbi:MAG: helix-turn-helix domain-containing protein, partial [Actinomycetota bacterium]
TQTLRKLEAYGLVGRRAEPTIPPSVEYSLTSLGESLTGPLGDVFRWAEAHVDEIPAVRRVPIEDLSP